MAEAAIARDEAVDRVLPVDAIDAVLVEIVRDLVTWGPPPAVGSAD